MLGTALIRQNPVAKGEGLVAPIMRNRVSRAVRLKLGAAARQEQNDDEAKKYFERAQETRPGDPGVRYQLALVAIDQVRLEDARQILEGLVKQSPQFTEAHVSLSLVYYRLKRPEDSKRERETVLKLTAEAQAKQPGAKVQ